MKAAYRAKINCKAKLYFCKIFFLVCFTVLFSGILISQENNVDKTRFNNFKSNHWLFSSSLFLSILDNSSNIFDGNNNYHWYSNNNYSWLLAQNDDAIFDFLVAQNTDYDTDILDTNLLIQEENLDYLTDYFDDLDIIDRTIYEKYYYEREKFLFLRPPDIDRKNMLKESFKEFQPTGFADKSQLDLNKYKNNFEYEFKRSEYFQNEKENYEISVAYTQHLDEYLANRKEELQRKIWDSLISTYDMKKAMSRSDLALLLGQATGMSIPLPPNPLLNIFGKPELSMNVNGQIGVTIGWRWDKQNLGSTMPNSGLRSSPIFRQDIRVNVSARIGDKLKFNIDQNTRAAFDFDNKFKIGYEGYDDDIIKKIEVGNIDFNIPSLLIGSGSALFGVRADFQFGPLFLKTVVSQRKGQRRFVDALGGTNKTNFSIRAWSYAKNHFFLDTVYKSIYNEYFKHSTPIIPKSAAPYRIKQIQVWEATTDVTNPHVANAVAIADLEGKKRREGQDWDASVKASPAKTGVVERGRFSLLDSNNFIIDYNIGTLTLKNFREDRFYAVSYRVEGETIDTVDDVYYGHFSNQVELKDTLILKLIYRPNMLPSYTSLWSRHMKNKYNIGASNVNINETSIGLWYLRQSNDSSDVIEGAADKLVTIFGVDRITNATGSTPPDGKFDINIPAFFNPERGEITFPHTEPFGEGLKTYFQNIGNPELAEIYMYRQIYDTTIEVAKRNTAKDRFIISGEVSGRSSNRINLNAYNLAPGSVRVTLNGVLLREHTDYIVEPYSGTLTLLNQTAMMPNANLRIEFEQRDVFTTATKTFLGIRADYDLFKNRYMTTTLGATAVRYSQAKISDRARLGDEPLANTMFGFDFKWTMDAPWLTKALDMLPFYDTKAPSSMNLFGEWAMVMPTPNRVNSEITSDNNQPVVEIDNFESITRTTSLGLSYSSWQHSSQPVQPDIFEIDSNMSEIEQGIISQNYRGRTFWWQYSYPRERMEDVYPKNRAFQSGMQNAINALYIHFDPQYRGIYNQNPEYLDAINPNFDANNPFYNRSENQKKIWGGIQRFLPPSSSNFDNDNIEFLDVMIKLDHYEGGKTRIFFDLGMVSEDLIPNGRPDTEDGITEANPLPNGILDPAEDIGMDAMNNAREIETYPYPLSEEVDPARDDFYFDFNKDDRDRNPDDYIKFNNYEGNGVSELGMFPDKEMLNPNNGLTLSLDNSYFTYELNIADLTETNPQIVGGNPPAGWYQFRIPIRKPHSKVGDPQFSNIQYVRFRVQGGGFHGRIADWKLVGTYWMRMSEFEENYNPNDSVLNISYVNVWENSQSPDFYTMPPGVQAPRLLGSLDYTYDARQNEQSLSLSVKNLLWGEERMAVKIFHSQDFFNYKRMKYFIHGDASMPSNLSGNINSKAKAYSFIRFGIDSANYYEYRRPIQAGWQEIDIELAQLVAIKQIRDTMMLSGRQTFPVPGEPNAHFAIKGNPILTKVRFIGLGVANPSDAFQELTTTLWVNELRLLSPEASNDWAGIVNFSTNLADLGTFNASFNNFEPNFHKVEERFGNRNQERDWNMALTGNLEKFAPKSFTQMKIPISYSHLERMTNPKFVAANDIELATASRSLFDKVINSGGTQEEAQRAADNLKIMSSTLTVQDDWSLTGVKTGIPVKHWLVSETVNRVTTSYSYSQIFERSPIVEERFLWVWRLSLNYSLPLKDILVFSPLKFVNANTLFFGAYKDWKLNFLPSNITLDLNMQRRRQTEQSRFLDVPSPVIREFSATRSASINWRFSQGGFLNPTIDYTFTTGSTLVPFELDEFGRQRTGRELAGQIFNTNNAAFVDFGINNNHSQNVTINLKPIFPSVVGLNKFFDITGLSYTTNYRWSDPLQPDPEIRDAAKNAAVNSNLRFTSVLRLRDIGNNIFGTPKPPFSKTPQTSSTATSTNTSFLGGIGSVFKSIFFGWERINFNYNLTNSAINPGVFGSTGMDNFWGRGLTFRESQMTRGPSFAYQMGLVGNPHGSWKTVRSDKFPYFGFDTDIGLRPPNAVFQDNYNQTNNFEVRTSRGLWEGATLDLNWKTTLTFNRNQTVDTDEFGNPTFSNIIAQDNLNRTFITPPTLFGQHLFGNPVDKVVAIFNEKRVVIDNLDIDSLSKNEAMRKALSESFYEGLEAFSITSGKMAKVLPSVNWNIRWEGIEKWKIWNNTVRRMTIEHNYISTYTEVAQITDMGRIVQTQSLNYGFSPLFGLSASFDEKLLRGVFQSSIKWSETSTYSATTASGAIISLQRTTDITATASYVMKGITIPFLGFNIKNDLEFSFLFTFKKNKTGTFDVLDDKSFSGSNAVNGRTLTGNTQIIVEPRARYNINQMFSASFYIRYEGTFNEGASNPGFHTTQVALDIMMNISGGR